MTRDEAIKELEQLDPKEKDAWERYDSRIKRRDQDYASLKLQLDQVHPEAQTELRELDSHWSPMYRRKQLLKAFLELTQ